MRCRPWRPACSAISATTRCGSWRIRWQRPPRSDRHPGRHYRAPHLGDRVRCRRRHDHRRYSGAATKVGQCESGARARAQAPGRRSWPRSIGRSANPRPRLTAARSTSRRVQTPRPRNSSAWWCARRSTLRPAISFRWCCRSASKRRFELPPFALYRALRRINPSPYLFFLDYGDFAIAGSSPEILVKA